MNTNVLWRWIEENKRDPARCNRRKFNDRGTKEVPLAPLVSTGKPKAKPMPALMLPVMLAETAVALPSISPSMIEVELIHGRVRLHSADATMLAGNRI
jgi:hypothetical protein